jgi:hypothetical protein
VPQHITDIFESHPLTQQLPRKRLPQTVKAYRLNLDFGGSNGPFESASYFVWAKRDLRADATEETDDGTLRLDVRSASSSPVRHQLRRSVVAAKLCRVFNCGTRIVRARQSMSSKLNAASSERRNPYEAASSRIVKSRSANGVAQSVARIHFMAT